MIIVCTHKSPNILKRFIESFIKFSTEHHKILIVETSDSVESKKIADDYGCLFCNTDLKYEIGAYNTGVSLYPDEAEYFLFQDSLEAINYKWEEMFRVPSLGYKLTALCSYKLSKDPCPGAGKEWFENLFNIPFPTDGASGILCNSFYLPQKAKEALIKHGIQKVVANNKNDTYGTERVLGAMAYIFSGFATTEEHVGSWIWDETHFRKETGFTKFIYKHILMRQ
jgi:glycosyltransferase involved in cell wall biosynthesis